MCDLPYDVVLGNKKNYLVLKDEVGKAKPSTRDLPGDDFAFGKADRNKQEGVGVITTSWLYHKS